MQKVIYVKNYQAYWILTLAFVTLCYIPRISEKGMFIDGLVYTTLAHNLSEGTGTFWQPVMKNSEFLYQKSDVFYDHPPLEFGIESIFYKLFGDQTEWIYNTFILLLLLLALVLLFKLFEPEKNVGYLLGFLPIFFLFTIPELIQKISYNLLDTTMAVFTSFAVYFLLRAVHLSKHFFFWSSMGGIFIVLAFLTKGPVGLFPLTCPILYLLFYDHQREWKRPLMATIIVILILALAGFTLYTYQPSHDFFKHYLNQQVLASMKGEREKANTIYNHLSIFKKIGIQVSPMLLLTALIWFIRRRTVTTPFNSSNKSALLLLMIGFSASVPIAISAKHHSFYLFPSFIFFSLAFAAFLSSYFSTTDLISVKKINRLLTSLSIVMIIIVTVYSFSRSERYYHSHGQFLEDMESLTKIIQDNSTIGIPEDILYHRGEVSCYFERYHHIELNTPVTCCSYFLIPGSDASVFPDATKVLETKSFTLFKHLPDQQ